MQYFTRVKWKFERRSDPTTCQKKDTTIVRTALTEGRITMLFIIPTSTAQVDLKKLNPLAFSFGNAISVIVVCAV
jgi:hypothetical protein